MNRELGIEGPSRGNSVSRSCRWYYFSRLWGAHYRHTTKDSQSYPSYSNAEPRSERYLSRQKGGPLQADDRHNSQILVCCIMTDLIDLAIIQVRNSVLVIFSPSQKRPLRTELDARRIEDVLCPVVENEKSDRVQTIVVSTRIELPFLACRDGAALRYKQIRSALYKIVFE